VSSIEASSIEKPQPSVRKLTRLPQSARAVLSRFGAREGDLLGRGSESAVYALGREQVLRVALGNPASRDLLARTREFLADLAGRLPYRTPEILEIGADGAFTVERRLPGRPMTEALRETTGAARAHLWAAYADAIAVIGTVVLPGDDYRHLLDDTPVVAPTWQAFIADNIRRSANRNAATIEREAGPVGPLLERSLAHTPRLDAAPPRVLVHGDAWPGNVMVDDAGRIVALGDFGPFTVAGDATLDAASALLPLAAMDVCTDADVGFVHDLMMERFGDRLDRALPAYRAWFALTTADPAYALPGADFLAWSRRTLREMRAE